jgi:hypothetical protein
MRENARRIGASSSYIESLDRSADVVLTVITAAKPPQDVERNPGDAAQSTVSPPRSSKR